jgi:hypothetical protein
MSDRYRYVCESKNASGGTDLTALILLPGTDTYVAKTENTSFDGYRYTRLPNLGVRTIQSVMYPSGWYILYVQYLAGTGVLLYVDRVGSYVAKTEIRGALYRTITVSGIQYSTPYSTWYPFRVLRIYTVPHECWFVRT